MQNENQNPTLLETKVPKSSRRNKIIILSVLVIAAAPLILSAWLVFSGWQPAQSRKHGEWVQQNPYFFKSLTLLDEAGNVVLPEHFHEKWVLLFFTADQDQMAHTENTILFQPYCDADCEKKLYALRQSVLAQDLQASRVLSAWIRIAPPTHKTLPAALPSTLTQALTFIEPYRLSPDAKLDATLSAWLQTLPQQGLFVIDPTGRAVLHFPHYTSLEAIRGIVKDLMKLLKVSQIG